MKEITKKSQLHPDAVYYSQEYERRGNKHKSWTRFYNADLEVLEDVQVRYTDALEGLTRVAQRGKDDRILSAYLLTPIKNGFMKVEKTDYTAESLKVLVGTMVGAK